ncbi:n19m, NADH-ubiquinone oxidoreductase 9.5 kDa subunit [Elasticomyces elasticus]|uniref:N19m, NADH-ubiquinone oxidoreductase 9.5 kDa subunit n=1 Tax=Elasticomyces elasticus TaxID=574655 RepID=A0AAN7WR41_9PEZI|nr:n19m, NADH-ubiquinone oxidoreductase 9.5 kDa subunit [Elasticomyces elasticus]KAK4973653.1 n19m, NADH-ubiquinone oxidoreductase 9.5 kDa subunit [Elasticomyces elasticus]KAK5707761.1 n19m, NADH-ubiquinone oxidoreductase 9.5 kDa subunit [Elasticomyces elasticus]
MAPVSFWSTPGTYIHWAARHKPAIFWSMVVGSMGPVVVVVAPPIRRFFGDGPRSQIPLTYPGESVHVQHAQHAGSEQEQEQEIGAGIKVDLSSRKTNLDLTVPRGPRRIPSGYDD